MRAGEFVAAGFAQGQRRIAPAVEEQHRLFARGQRLSPARRAAAATAIAPCARHRPIALVTQIDQPDLRHFRHAMARRQLQMVIAAACGIDEAFQRRRGAGQHHRAILDPRPHHRHVAGVIDGAVLLLEGLFVFFVHDHQAQFAERAGTATSARPPPPALRRSSPRDRRGGVPSATGRSAIPPAACRSARRSVPGTAPSARSPAAGSAPACPAASASATASK